MPISDLNAQVDLPVNGSTFVFLSAGEKLTLANAPGSEALLTFLDGLGKLANTTLMHSGGAKNYVFDTPGTLAVTALRGSCSLVQSGGYDFKPPSFAPIPVAASRPLNKSDQYKCLVCAAGVTLTNDGTLPFPFTCMVYGTAGQVVFASSGNGTIINPDTQTKTEKALAAACLMSTLNAGELLLYGRTGA